MTAISNFSIRVNHAGLPVLNYPHNSYNNETLLGVSASTIAKLFWMLESLQISYAYEVNGININRNYTIQHNIPPIERLHLVPTFHYENFDQQFGLFINADLDLWNVFYSSPSSYNLVFTINEYDNNNLFTFSNYPLHILNITPHSTTSFNFSFLEYPMSISLHSKHPDISGSISSFSITPTFFSIKNP